MKQLNQWFNEQRPDSRSSKAGSADAHRMEFEVDLDRIIFSRPFRSLQNKTQVVPLPEHDFVHTRLTHSLEVSSVARSLGRQAAQGLMEKGLLASDAAYLSPQWGAVCAAAALAHDLGNPPFGHAGEEAISRWFQKNHLPGLSVEEQADLQAFEGNAQGFRLLVGRKDLRPTFATLGAFSKYPCPAYFPKRDKSKRSQKKYGWFRSEEQAFRAMAEACGLPVADESLGAFGRHPLCWLVEAADDISYLLVDLEDAVLMGVVPLTGMLELVQPILGKGFEPNPRFWKRPLADQAGLLRAMAIQQLIRSAGDTYVANAEAYISGALDRSLDELLPESQSMKELQGFSRKHIYQSERVLELQAAGFELLPKLMDMFMEACLDRWEHGDGCSARNRNLTALLPVDCNPDHSVYDLARQVIDFLASFSDRQAMRWYRKLQGIEL